MAVGDCRDVGLIGTILGVLRSRPGAVAGAVGLYISAAYWFTASTSFANPALTVARSLSDTLAGIHPHGVPGFVVAELAGAALAWALFGWLFQTRNATHIELPDTTSRSCVDAPNRQAGRSTLRS